MRWIRWYLSFVIPMCEAAGMIGHTYSTYTITYTHTYTQDNYSNPRCACAPRVNYEKSVFVCPTRSTFHILYHKFAVSCCYSQDPTEIQYNYIYYIYKTLLRIPPTALLLRSLEIPMAQVIDALVPWVLTPSSFPIFEGGVRLRQTTSEQPCTVTLWRMREFELVLSLQPA